ncbi:MAG: hypothetical protein GYA36_15960 [Veillonellaceae bacterium]|nr:hypothetical protein [Veillonellaceae bacterium]
MALPILSMLGGTLIGGAISLLAFGTGVGDIVNVKLNQGFQAKVLSAAELIRCYLKGVISETQFYEEMTKVGLNRDNARRLAESTPDGLNTTEILTLWFRYGGTDETVWNITEQWLKDRFSESGLNLQRQKEIIEANRPVPSLQDIITFAVRDVFESEQVEQGKLMAGVPDVYLSECRKRGLDETDAKYYWAAHWNLPSLTQVYEMFHRLYPGSGYPEPFTEADMDIFFNLADIAPGYRNKLKQISYQPLTRVDIRRMWRTGFYQSQPNPVQRLIHDHRQLGYSPEDAQRLANYVMQTEGSGRKKLTYSQIVNFYINNIWGDDSKETALKELENLGYSSTYAEKILTYIDLKNITSEEKTVIEGIKEKYLNGVIETEAELRTALFKVPLEASAVNKYIKDFQSLSEKRKSRLSKAEAVKLYQAELITASEFRTLLEYQGYIAKDIDLLLKYYGKGRAEDQKLPLKDDIISWIESEFIDEYGFIYYMRKIGYNDELILLYYKSLGLEFSQQALNKLSINEKIDYEKMV